MAESVQAWIVDGGGAAEASEAVAEHVGCQVGWSGWGGREEPVGMRPLLRAPSHVMLVDQLCRGGAQGDAAGSAGFGAAEHSGGQAAFDGQHPAVEMGVS